jgi:glucose-6-phosphate isomerase
MTFTHSIHQAFAGSIGRYGLPEAHYETTLTMLRKGALSRLKREWADFSLPLLHTPEALDALSSIKAFADAVRADAADIVILGTGGSSLGGQTLAQLIGANTFERGRNPTLPRLHFCDNLDPVSFSALLETLDPGQSRFIAVSKSGGTGETLMQTAAVIDALRVAKVDDARIGRCIFGLSEPEKPGKRNALRALLAPYGSLFLDHHTGIGGRYSVLTNTGLLPACLLGLDAAAILAGAGHVVQDTLGNPDSAALSGTALNLTAMQNGHGIAVLMPYADRLERLIKWWVQLWAESLGKDGKGSQPVGALGPVDQHSQQQLYLAGPRDKLFTVITVATQGIGPVIAPDLALRMGEPGFAGKSIGDLVAAQGRAMIDTFASNGRPVRHIHLERLDETALGALLMHFMLETILTGYGLGIDPFDQPAVEEAKILAKRYLERDAL